MLTVTDKINTGSASGSDGGEEIKNQDKTITENGEYTADVGYTGLGTVTVNISDIPAVIEELNVTPTTSAQTIIAPEGTDGYSPVNVAAVNSSIDQNIVASNIKSGVNILSVTGTLEAVDTITATNNSSSVVTSGDKVWLSEAGISGQSTSAINQHWAMSTSGNYVPTVANFNIYPSEVINSTTYNTSSTSVVGYDISSSPSYIPNYIYGDSGCYSAQYSHVFACDDSGVYGHTLNSANSTVFKTFVIGSNIVWSYNNSVSSYAFHRMDRNGITLLPNTTSANNTNDNYFYTNGYLYKEPTKNTFYDRFDGSYRTYNLETGELGSEVGFSINSLSDWWYPHIATIFGVTSDGKYIIGANTNPDRTNYMKLQFGKINSVGNLTKVGTAPAVLANFYDNGGTSRYLACSFNPNNNLLILTEFNTANYWMFKYNPSDESWSDVTIDLSNGFIFTGKYFQGPMCASNDMKNFSFVYSTSTGDPGRNVYQAYVRMGSMAIVNYANISQNSLTGVAQENIAIGSSGSVKTILPSTQENNNNQNNGGNDTITCVINFEDASDPDTDLSGEHIFIEFQEADETVISYTETVAGEPFSIPAGTYYLVLHTDNVYIIDQEVLTITELEAENYNITIPVMV